MDIATQNTSKKGYKSVEPTFYNHENAGFLIYKIGLKTNRSNNESNIIKLVMKRV
jgi:hypothetical protein